MGTDLRKSEYCDNINLNDYFHIQDFGALMILDINDLSILSVSDNVERFLNISPVALLNNSFLKYIDDDTKAFIEDIRNLDEKNTSTKLIELNINGGLVTVVLSVYIKNSYLVLEFDEYFESESDHDKIFNLSHLGDQLTLAESDDEICSIVLNDIYALTQYRSIMIYQYQEEGYGKVISHLKPEGDIDYTDHHFPATDTPKPIMDLFLKGIIRYIPNINYSPSQLLGVITKKEINISESSLRGVVPIHITFLENMGAKAAISVPIIIEKKLWGLIACQHNEVNYISVRKRKLLKVVSSMLSFSLLNLKLVNQTRLQKKVLQSFKSFHLDFVDDPDDVLFTSTMKEWLSGLTDYIAYDGMTYCSEQGVVDDGNHLSVYHSRKIYDYFSTRRYSNVIFITHSQLQQVFFKEKIPNEIKGIALIIINREQNMFVILYRLGEAQKLKWAGNPSTNFDNPNDISPRGSFKTWTEEHVDSVKPWTDFEKSAIEQVQVILAEKSYRAELTEQAFYDNLTELYNRHYLEDAYKRNIKIAKRRGVPFSLCILDVDLFKNINDKYGHDAGDKVLVELASIISKSFRTEDIVCRYGGEEFVILMLGAPHKIAFERCERLRKKIETTKIVIDDKEISMTISIGIAISSPKECHTLEELVKKADVSLYESKENGRNQVSPKVK